MEITGITTEMTAEQVLAAYEQAKAAESGEWPKEGDGVWFLWADGSVNCADYEVTYTGKLSQGNVFPTEAAAIRERDLRAARHRLATYLREHGLEREFVKGEPNYAVDWHFKLRRFSTSCMFNLKLASPFYAATREDAQQIVRDCEADLKVIFRVEG